MDAIIQRLTQIFADLKRMVDEQAARLDRIEGSPDANTTSALDRAVASSADDEGLEAPTNALDRVGEIDTGNLALVRESTAAVDPLLAIQRENLATAGVNNVIAERIEADLPAFLERRRREARNAGRREDHPRFFVRVVVKFLGKIWQWRMQAYM